jgi:putative ABC transport system substrate-binding protein
MVLAELQSARVLSSEAKSMRRREFIMLVGTMAVTSPLAARDGPPSIGFLGPSTPSSSKDRTEAFLRRLRELDWIEGHSISIEYRWAEGRTDRYSEIAAEFVRLRVDLIFTGGAGAVIAVKRVTSTIPIVFGVASDPVGTGLVASLARPGGNVTGMSIEGPDLAGKRLELLRQLVPRLVRLAVIGNPDASGAALELREVQAAAHILGIELSPVLIRRVEDITSAFATLTQPSEALYVCADPLVNSHRSVITENALAAQLPTMFGERENVDAGGLISYGPSIPDLYRRAAEQVDKILRHANPADIPVEQPTKFELVVNMKTAKALGITIPPGVLAIADDVIE